MAEHGTAGEFDRPAAVTLWRTSLLSRGGVTIADVDELQDHLEQIEEGLSGQLRPEEAFWVAAHRVGTPDVLTREYRKLRPDAGWLLRAQWALLGVITYWLVLPAAHAAFYGLAASLASLPALAPVAAVLRLLASPLSLAAAIAFAVLIVRGLRLSPEAVEGALLRASGSIRTALLVAVVVFTAWQYGLGLVVVGAMGRLDAQLSVPGQPAALQSSFWSLLALASSYLLPALAFVLAVRLQRRRIRSFGS